MNTYLHDRGVVDDREVLEQSQVTVQVQERPLERFLSLLVELGFCYAVGVRA